MSVLDFYQAPASKALFYGSGLGTLASLFFFKTPWAGYDVTAFAGGRLHRVLANQFFFAGVGEMLLGVGLIYRFRLFERRMGTSRFLSFTLLSTALSLSLQMIFLVMLPGFDGQTPTRMAPGPYSYIFSLFVHFFAFVPKLQKRQILGTTFSEKTFIYFLGSQLLFARGKDSVMTGVCGFLGGLLCLVDKLPFKRADLPEPLRKFGKCYLAPLFSTRSPSELAAERARQQQEQPSRLGLAAQGLEGQGLRRVGAGGQMDQLIPDSTAAFVAFMQRQQQQQQQQTRGEQAAFPEPPEELVTSLMDLGFDREVAIHALRAHGNDVHRAAESLLS